MTAWDMQMPELLTGGKVNSVNGYCPRCGSIIDDPAQAGYCTQCGAPLSEPVQHVTVSKTCRHCQQPIVGNPKTCPYCGQSLSSKLPFIVIGVVVLIAAIAAIMLFVKPGESAASCTVYYYDSDTNAEIQEHVEMSGVGGSSLELPIPVISGYTFDHYTVNGESSQTEEDTISVPLPANAGAQTEVQLYYSKSGGGGLHPKTTLEDYSWDELSSISKEISAASSQEDALEIAEQYNLVDADGRINEENTKTVKLSNGVTAEVQIIGFAHDTRSDGGVAGITFAFCDCVADRTMNPTPTNAGGWRDSATRGWLNKAFFSALPEDLQEQIVSVEKWTNNVGRSDSPGCVSQTSDKVWLLSATEVFGTITWYGPELPYNDIFNQEGTQYQLYRDAGVIQDSSNPTLVKVFLPASSASDDGFVKGEPCFWWLRTPGMNYDTTFRRVDNFGYPLFNDDADKYTGVAPAFCI